MKDRIDLTNCDREPIHIPGAILPHGVMLVLDCNNLHILQAAGDTMGLLDKPIEDLLGRPADTIFRADQIKLLRDLLAESKLSRPRHLLDPTLRVVSSRPLDASVHRSDDSLILEFETSDDTERYAGAPLAAVQEMLEGLNAADSLHQLCQTAARQVRRAIGYDRVMIYRFAGDGSGWVFAENREERLVPFLDLHYPASDIPAQARALYLKNTLRLIPRVNYNPSALVPSINPQSGRPLDMSNATLRDVSPIHREYLRNMGVNASMSISIVAAGRLWGLIACHHSTPRNLPRHLRAACELFGELFSFQLDARERADQVAARHASRSTLQKLLRDLSDANDYCEGLLQLAPQLLDYIPASGATTGLPSRGVTVRFNSSIRSVGETPTEQQIIGLFDWLTGRNDEDEGIFITDRLGELYSPAKAFAEVGSGLLAVSISRQPKDFILWFRPEVIETVSWAGDPIKPVEGSIHGDRLTPRKSFEIWKEEVRGRSTPWLTSEKEAAFDLRVSLIEMVLRRSDEAARQREHAHAREQLLMAELDHRVKNTLANIQALVKQSSRNADSLQDFVQGLEARIAAMAKAHSLLTISRWQSVAIRALVEEELRHYETTERTFKLDGPEFQLTPKAALALSLAIHELATNAVKYGALSWSQGIVSIAWRQLEHGGVEFRWQESGGPPVQAPTRRGFGSTLIERALTMETGGQSKITFHPDGVQCEVILPASAFTQPTKMLT